MIDFASPILQWLNSHPDLAGFATFLISAAESVAIIGTIVPGSVMMTAIGALVGAGIIPFWPTLTWAIFGAIVGDGISYWIGYHFKTRLHHIWPFETHPNLLASGKSFFDKHGAKSVFIGRFVGPVRALVPLVAGMLDVAPLRFTIANVVSAIGWAPLYMLPGILLGAASVELSPEIATRVVLILILTGLFIILCLWLLKKIIELIQNEINQFLTWIWHALKKSRYFYIVTAALKHHDKRKPYGQLTLGFYFILTSIALLYVSSIIIYQGSQNISINNAAFYLFRSLRTPTADNVMLYISFLGEKYVLLPLSLTLSIWFAWTKRMHTAYHILGLGIIAISSIEAAKHFVRSTRPWGIVNANYSSNFSFPSGHTTLAVLYYFALALLIIKVYEIKRGKKIIYALAGALITAISLSRLYFGVHWLTDIIGSALLGAVLLMLVVLSYNRTTEKKSIANGLILTTFLTLLVTFTISIHLTFDKFKSAYTMLKWPAYNVTFHDWWTQQNNPFPLYRVNRIGIPAKIFNVQWSENLDTIKTVLLKNGWAIAPKHDWLRVIYRITAVNSTQYLPLVSPTYLDSAPVLVLIKQIGKSNKLLVLRLWSSSYLSIHPSKFPIWMGSLEYAPSTYSWLFKHKHITDVALTPSLLFSTLPTHYEIKEITVIATINKKTIVQPVLLIKPKT